MTASTISFSKEVGTTWTKITDAGDGDTYYIQPVNAKVEYIILESAPTTEEGGVIDANDQLAFAKISGDLYVRVAGGQGKARLYINKQESAS